MKYLLVSLLFLTNFTSCSTLRSNTVIKPQDSFILGNNKHGKFKVKLQNVSKNDLEIYQAPITGGKHSPQMVKPGQKVTVKIDQNTALYLLNHSMDTSAVNLKVSGDIGLSMGYKN